MSSFYNESGGYPENIFTDSFDDDLRCVICLMIMKNAQRICDNDHYLCLSCAREITTCPTCREELIPLKPARFVNEIILKLPVKCYIKDAGCEWIGKLGDIEKHVVASCGYVTVACSNAGCNTFLQRRLIAQHEETCGHKVVNCDFCSEPVKVLTTFKHKESCPSRPVLCTRDCGVTVPLNFMNDHVLCCPQEIVDCPYKSLMGCSYRGCRKDMPAHSADISCHFSGLIIALAKVTSNNEEMKDTIKCLEQNIHGLHERIIVLEADVFPEENNPSNSTTQTSLASSSSLVFPSDFMTASRPAGSISFNPTKYFMPSGSNYHLRPNSSFFVESESSCLSVNKNLPHNFSGYRNHFQGRQNPQYGMYQQPANFIPMMPIPNTGLDDPFSSFDSLPMSSATSSSLGTGLVGPSFFPTSNSLPMSSATSSSIGTGLDGNNQLGGANNFSGGVNNYNVGNNQGRGNVSAKRRGGKSSNTPSTTRQFY